MSKHLCRIMRGIRYSEKYGDHPGNMIIVSLIACGWICGGWLGALVMAISFGPMYLIGCWSRGV